MKQTPQLSLACRRGWLLFHIALSVWICQCLIHDVCCSVLSRHPQMTSPKVLIDAQCLLIKKLVLLTATVVHANTRCSLKTALELERGIKKQQHQAGEMQHLNGGWKKKQVLFVHSPLLHVKWQTKPVVWRSLADWALPFVCLTWNNYKEIAKGFWSSYDFLFSSTL